MLHRVRITTDISDNRWLTLLARSSRYGQGYKLDLRLDINRSDVDEVLRFIQEGCNGLVKLEELELPMMTLTVPFAAASLPNLMGRLALARDTHGVLECSVNQCTLEQIFLLMANKSQLRSTSD